MAARVLVLCDYGPLSGARIGYEVSALHAAGYEVRMLSWDRAPLAASRVERFGDVPIQVAAIEAPYGSSLGALSHMLSVYLRLMAEIRKMCWSFDVIHCTHLFLLPLGAWAARSYRAKLVYDCYELVAISASSRLAFGRSTARRTIELVESWLASRADGILAVDSRAGGLERRLRRSCDNLAVLDNVPALTVQRPDPQHVSLDSKAWPGAPPVVAYAGLISADKGMAVTFQAVARVKRHVPDIRLKLMGSVLGGDEAPLREMAAELGLSQHIEVLPWLSYEDLQDELRRAAIGVAPYQPVGHLVEVGRGARKVFTYMDAGIPVIAPRFGEVGLVVSQEACGLRVDTADPEALAGAILYLLKHPEEATTMGRSGRRAIESRYNWDIEKRKLLQVYSRLR